VDSPDSSRLPLETAELVGALTGDKGVFKKTKRYGFYRGYDLSKYHRYQISICLGKDKDWGRHISDLIFRSYGLRGSICYDKNEWRFHSSSTRVFKDLSMYYNPDWNARRWRINPALLSSSTEIRRRFARGYFDADGYPYFSRARDKVFVQINSVNRNGLEDMRVLLRSLGYNPGLYRRYKKRDVWEVTIQRKSEVIRFYDEIGFSIMRKQEKLRRMLRRKWPECVE
jgi:intein/homing endonuclease